MEHFKFSCRGGNQRRDDNLKKKSFESLQSVKSKEDSRQKIKKKMELKNGSIGHQIFHFSEEYFY